MQVESISASLMYTKVGSLEKAFAGITELLYGVESGDLSFRCEHLIDNLEDKAFEMHPTTMFFSRTALANFTVVKHVQYNSHSKMNSIRDVSICETA